MPVILIWSIFIIVKNFYTHKSNSSHIYNILDQLKKNVDVAAAIGNALLNTEVELKSSFALREFDTLVSDINEVLAEIIKRSNSISSSQMEHLWTRTAGGERWLIAKTFIETFNFQPGFSEHLTQKAGKDSLLRGSILEFHARYQNLQDLLETFDKQKIFYSMIEYGALGKVFRILTPIAETLCNDKKTNTSPQESYRPIAPELPLSAPSVPFPSFLQEELPSTPLKKTPSFRQPEQKIAPSLQVKEQHVSPISNSFGDAAPALQNLKNTNKSTSEPTKRKIISLDELEKEINASPENNYDEYAYPFGNWPNEKNKK